MTDLIAERKRALGISDSATKENRRPSQQQSQDKDASDVDLLGDDEGAAEPATKRVRRAIK